MTGSLHIYTRPLQPATEWVDNCGPTPMTICWPPRLLIWCRACYRRRRAENCVVQAYYDALMIWCAPGKGCKDPVYLARIERRKTRNRRAGQLRRRAKEEAA